MSVADPAAHNEPTTQIIVYICPTPGCGNHYASPDFRPDVNPDIIKVQERRKQDGTREPSHSRVECPACRTAGRGRVERVPYIVTRVAPLREALRAVGAPVV